MISTSWRSAYLGGGEREMVRGRRERGSGMHLIRRREDEK